MTELPINLTTAILDYMEIADEVAHHEALLKFQRTYIENQLHAEDLASFTVDGVATARIAPGYERISYDTDALDRLVMELIEANTELTDVLARKIRNCKKTTAVKGSLRIEKEKR